MKECSYCGKEHPDEATTCVDDGQPLISATPNQPGSGAADENSLPPADIAVPAVAWLISAFVLWRLIGGAGLYLLAFVTAVGSAIDCSKLQSQASRRVGIAFKPVVVFGVTAFLFWGFGFFWYLIMRHKVVRLAAVPLADESPAALNRTPASNPRSSGPADAAVAALITNSASAPGRTSLADYLARPFTGEPTHGSLGDESDWLDFCILGLRGSQIHVVDARDAADHSQGCMVLLPPGEYELLIRVIAYGKDVRFSCLRVIRPKVLAVSGRELGRVRSDSGRIGLYDFEVVLSACGKDQEAAHGLAAQALNSTKPYGLAVLDQPAGAVMAFVTSECKRRTFPVHELLNDGVRVGFEVTFIRPEQRYPP